MTSRDPLFSFQQQICRYIVSLRRVFLPQALFLRLMHRVWNIFRGLLLYFLFLKWPVLRRLHKTMLCFASQHWDESPVKEAISFLSAKSIHPKITGILNAQDDGERKVMWKKTDGSTIFAVRCCFRVTGAISEHYSFVETLNSAMRSSFQRTLPLECSCIWRYGFVEPWNLVK